jgi:amidohydrolase
MPERMAQVPRAARNLHAEVARRRSQVVELRRHFHMHPELAMQEHSTAAAIAQRLRASGLEVREAVGGTGVVGLLHGGAPGRTLLIRADMDALPVEEQNASEYISRTPGRMHACGHDGHVAIALVVADLLAEWRADLQGNVKFAFQPAEEQVLGAAAMVADGVLRDPDVDAAIGLHVWTPIHVGEVVVQAGPFFASADSITLRVRGRGGHGAMPHLNVDPVVATAHIVVAAQTLVSREISPFDSAVVAFGMIHGGTAGNIVADEVELGGTVRAYSLADREHLLRRLGELASSVAGGLRASAKLVVGSGTGPVINDPAITDLVRRAAVATVGADHIPSGDKRQSVSDDMSVFLEAVPGCYFLVGAGNPERGIAAPHHSSQFDLDEDALPIGVEVLARAALDYLGAGSSAGAQWLSPGP